MIGVVVLDESGPGYLMVFMVGWRDDGDWGGGVG